MRGCGEVKKAIGESEEEVRKKVDCQVAQVDLILTRNEFEVMPYLRVFDGAALRIFKKTFDTMEGFYKKEEHGLNKFDGPAHSGTLYFFLASSVGFQFLVAALFFNWTGDM